MRISSAFAYESSLSNLQHRQEALTDAQQRLTSGKRVLKASDDPAAAARAERALAASKRADAQQRALDASRTTMQLTESALGDAGELVQQARDLIVQAGNGSYTDAERKTLADSIRGLRNDLLAVANRGDGSGRYLFGGQGNATAPFVDGVGGVSYGSVAGQQQGALGEGAPLTLDGRAAWMDAPDPANAGATVSIFSVLDQAATDLSTAGRSGAQTAATVSTALAGVDSAAVQLSSWRSRAGEALNRADALANRLSQDKLDAESQRSAAEDLDMLAAISDFQNRQSGYDAALKTYSTVQRMSLFDYIK